MSIFDDLEKSLRAKLGATAEANAAARGALDVLGGLDQGFDTLQARFREAGLKDRVDSWVAKGRNLPVTAAEVKAALGPEVDRYALKAQLTVEEAASRLAAALPELVDKLTPDGAQPKLDELKRSLGQVKDRLSGKSGDQGPPTA